MLKVALTGGIATGKSHVLEQFRQHGVPCLDADTLAHGVEAAGTEATAAIAVRFGPEILTAQGAVDRAKLGPIVFKDTSARRDLAATAEMSETTRPDTRRSPGCPRRRVRRAAGQARFPTANTS